MTDETDLCDPDAPMRTRSDVPAERACLSCRTVFFSGGFGERICPKCKGERSWRGAVGETGSTGRKRGGRSS